MSEITEGINSLTLSEEKTSKLTYREILLANRATPIVDDSPSPPPQVPRPKWAPTVVVSSVKAPLKESANTSMVDEDSGSVKENQAISKKLIFI